MRSTTLFVLVGLLAVVLAEGQFYVPRAYYTIDAEGHESLPVPLRRLRRSIRPNYYPGDGGASANANANAEANSWGGDATANANAVANARAGGGYQPYPGLAPPTLGVYGSSRPTAQEYGTVRQAGPIALGAAQPRSVSASSYVGLDSSGQGYYDQQTSVGS